MLSDRPEDETGVGAMKKTYEKPTVTNSGALSNFTAFAIVSVRNGT
jgi:hypothetical protein